MSASQLTMRGGAHAATLFGFGAFLLVAPLCTPLLGALAQHAVWTAFWFTAAGLAALGATLAGALPGGPLAAPSLP